MTKHTILFLALALAGFGCGDDDGSTADTGTDSSTDSGTDTSEDGQDDPFADPSAGEAAASYAEIVHASYEDSAALVDSMNAAIDTFLNDPTEDNLAAARQAWIDARPTYLETEVYRFYDGPIDGDDGEPEGQINAWPLDENNLDYVDGDATAGRINDASFEINETNLLAANGENGEADVATGWHAIEFLLWGQDLTEPSEMLPGQRPFTDYTTADNADRRSDYLRLTGEILAQHMDELTAAWEAGAANYRADFEADSARSQLEKALAGMIVLSGFETGSERLLAALDAHDQEEEHSCFSDNTHIDMIYDLIGVRNVWTGEYTRTDGSEVSGTGIVDFVNTVDASLAQQISDDIDNAVSLAQALQPPFDNEISATNTEGNARVQALIDACFTLNASLTTLFTSLDLTVPDDAMGL